MNRPEYFGPDAIARADASAPDTAAFTNILFDLETNGLLDTVSIVHCMVAKCLDTSAVRRFADEPKAHDIHGSIAAGVTLLRDAKQIVAHNGISYDLPVLAKLFSFTPTATVRDTLVLSRLAFPDIAPFDYARIKKGLELSGKLIGSHSLAAWGIRLGLHKGSYGKAADAWERFTPEMLDYCEQDVHVMSKLWEYLKPDRFPSGAIEMEHRVAAIIARQTARGFAFDVDSAHVLVDVLRTRQAELHAELQGIFPPWQADDGEFIPKRDNKRKGYVAGVPVRKTKAITFNPGSHAHIVDRLVTLRGWKPDKRTLTGKAALDETVLSALPYPEAKPLAEYLLVTKRLGQLVEGKQAWLNCVKNGRIHGSVNPNGTVTGRMAHFWPNIAQVPRVSSPYGKECRSLFRASEGLVLVGCDADALELRDLAGYMAKWDGGAYVRTVLEGRKEDGTDIHSVNMRALGLTNRDDAKTWFYAYIYGAGDARLGAISGGGIKVGREQRELFQKNLPALASLVAAVQKKLKDTGYLVGLDGRKLRARSAHAALNTLLQSAGAVQMKQALIILDDDLARFGLAAGVDYEFVANIHDEWQIEATPDIAELVGRTAADAIRKAGEHFAFACPLKGNYSIGHSWADSH